MENINQTAELAHMGAIGTDAAKTDDDKSFINLMSVICGGISVAAIGIVGIPAAAIFLPGEEFFEIFDNPNNFAFFTLGIIPAIIARKSILREIFTQRILGIMGVQSQVLISRKNVRKLDKLRRQNKRIAIPLSDVLDIPEAQGKMLSMERNVFAVMETVPVEKLWDNAFEAITEFHGLNQKAIPQQKSEDMSLPGSNVDLRELKSTKQHHEIATNEERIFQQEQRIKELQAALMKSECANSLLEVQYVEAFSKTYT